MGSTVLDRLVALFDQRTFGFGSSNDRDDEPDTSDHVLDDGECVTCEQVDVLVTALHELSPLPSLRAFDESKHLRNPKGSPGGGKFRSMVDRLKDAITQHAKGDGKGHPFDGFDRPQLYRVAKARGIELPRGASRDEIASRLLDDLHKGDVGKPKVEKAAEKAVKKAAPKKPKLSPAVSHADYTGPRYEQPSDADPKVVADLRSRLRVANPEGWSQGHVTRQLSGHPDPETRRLIAKAGPTVATRLAWEADNEAALARLVQLKRPPDPNLGPYDDLPPVTAAELDAAKAAGAAQIRKDFAGKDVVVRVTAESLAGILDDGRFKTQFETKRSGGGYVPAQRAATEKMMFGLAEDVDPKQRPIYGYVAVDGVDAKGGGDLLDTYGPVRVVLKPNVRSRTTASVGDSLDRQVLPSPIDDPSWESFNGAAHWTDGVAMDYEKQRAILYVEAQIHDGLPVDDIAEVVFPVEPSAAISKRLADRGISWRVLGQ